MGHHLPILVRRLLHPAEGRHEFWLRVCLLERSFNAGGRGGCRSHIRAISSDTEGTRLAFERVSFEKSVRQKLLTKGVPWVKEFFWENCARETLKLYRRVIGK